MKYLRDIYRVARSVLFSVIVFIAAIYLILYVLLSVPRVQDGIKGIVEREASKFLGGKVTIENLSLRPFNEAVLSGLEVYDPEMVRCLRVETLGAGINLRKLISGEGIEITYGEIIGLNATIFQRREDSPLNIGFIIDAFKPKDKNKPPSKFDINLRNVVIRRCSATFDRMWMPCDTIADKTDFNHLKISNFKGDVTFPRLSNDDFVIDLRRLAFSLSGGLDVEKLAFRTHITPNSISLRDFVIRLPHSDA